MADDIALAVDEALKGSERRTRRDNFAMAAISGMLAHLYPVSFALCDLSDFTDQAVKIADALIAELDKGEG